MGETKMHGLINRGIQSFVCNTYGVERWMSVTAEAGLGFSEFESMLIYDDQVTHALLRALCIELGQPESEILEDLGTHLVSDPKMESLRRLLRFGGETYQEFLHSLDELPVRTRLAVSDLHLPRLELREQSAHQFALVCAPGLRGYGRVMMGVLRAMADDYGALVYLEHNGLQDQIGAEVISITLVEADYARGRDFDLGARAG